MMICILSLFLPACTTTNFMVAKWKDWEGPPGSSGSQGAFKVGKPYYVDGSRYTPQESYTYDETGIASWYGPGFHSNHTANGERYDQNELTAAHKTLQLPSLVRVTNLENGRSVIVRVNDRGPFSKGRIIDVSKRAADLLGMIGKGTARVRVQVVAEGSRQLAEMARRGQSTKGTEMAYNDGSRPVAMAAPTTYTPNVPAVQTAALDVPAPSVEPQSGDFWAPTNAAAPVTPVSTVASYTPPPVPGHTNSAGRFYPDPVVKQYPVAPTALYIQAGAYSNYDNAQHAANVLGKVANVRVQPVMVRGQQYFRVQVGPFQAVGDADSTLSRVINTGYPEARITVDNSS